MQCSPPAALRPTRSLIVVTALTIALMAQVNGARAQVLPTVAGAAGGLVAGGIVTLSTAVARTTFTSLYVTDVRDLVGFTGIPLVAGPVTGATLGLLGSDILAGATVGGITGMAGGIVIGAVIGKLLTPEPDGPWIGGEIGAGAGLLLGAAVGGLLRATRRGGGTPSDPGAAARIPVAVTIRF